MEHYFVNNIAVENEVGSFHKLTENKLGFTQRNDNLDFLLRRSNFHKKLFRSVVDVQVRLLI